jgi:hypothetical protein
VHTDVSRRRVLVTDWVDGMRFQDVLDQPDEVRDRFVEIVFRFYYGTAAEMDLAPGDPHPGNYLLRADGRMAFVDFGMMRQLPAGYLGREALVRRAVRAGDSQGVLTGLRELGYLSGDVQEWDGDLLLRALRRSSAWRQGEQPLRLSPEEMWGRGRRSQSEDGAEAGTEPPQRSPEELAAGEARARQLGRLRLPPETLLLRRMQALLFQTAVMARASAAWGPLHRELLDGGEPVGDLGAAHAAWRSRA